MLQWYSARLSCQPELRYGNICIEHTEDSSIVDMALKTRHVSNPLSTQEPTGVTSSIINAVSRELVMSQIKVLLLNGHNTISSCAVYIYHLLSKLSYSLALIREEEHTSVFGPATTALLTLLASSLYALSMLLFTLASVRDALRPSLVRANLIPSFSQSQH